MSGDTASQEKRSPMDVQAWLIGGGPAALAAAVFLIQKAHVPGHNIHIFEDHPQLGGTLTDFDGPESSEFAGHLIHTGRAISRRDSCVEDFLSNVPSSDGRTLLDQIQTFNNSLNFLDGAPTRIIVKADAGVKGLRDTSFGLSVNHRLELLKVMVEGEHSLENRIISDMFHPTFFDTNFWIIWSTTSVMRKYPVELNQVTNFGDARFGFRPSHSVMEFRRHLHSYLHDIRTMDSPKKIFRTQYTQYESIVLPTTEFLRTQGVDFHLKERVVDVVMDSSVSSVKEIKVSLDSQSDKSLLIAQQDVVMITLGSIGSGSVTGTNTNPPNPVAAQSDTLLNNEWSLWFTLAKKSHKFGVPSNFSTRIPESRMEVFTVTLETPELFDRLWELTGNRVGAQPVLSLAASNWKISLNIPHQPALRSQTPDTYVFSGYALAPEKEGNYVQKPMLACSGQEIMSEILQLLNFPVESILSMSVTIPCVIPELAAPLLSRATEDRPQVIPKGTTNLALLGQFVDIPGEPTGTLEYSVRGAEIAVAKLLRVPYHARKSRSNLVMDFFDLLY